VNEDINVVMNMKDLSMIVQAEFEFNLGSTTMIIYESLLPEIEQDYQRTKTRLRLKKDVLVLNVEAKDIISMRAALNGWLRLIRISSEMSSIKVLNTQIINQ
jgi:KEOPS complex subunit Pcc1